MWLPEPSSIYFAILGGLLFGFLGGLYHPALRLRGSFLMLTFVFICFLGLQLLNDVVGSRPDVVQTIVRVTARFYIFTFSSLLGLVIIRWWRERKYDRLSQ